MDLYVIQLQDAIPLDGVVNIPATDTEPRKLLLSGRGFDRVIEFDVNNIPIQSGWTQLSATSVELELPEILWKATIVEIFAYSDTVHDKQSSRLVRKIGAGVRVTGIQAAIQLLMRWLFADPGSDAWYPQGGGGWRRAIGYTDFRGDGQEVMPQLIDGLNRTVAFVQAIQAQDPNIPAEERLASAEVVNTTKTPRGIRLTVKVETVGGDRFLLAVRAS